MKNEIRKPCFCCYLWLMLVSLSGFVILQNFMFNVNMAEHFKDMQASNDDIVSGLHRRITGIEQAAKSADDSSVDELKDFIKGNADRAIGFIIGARDKIVESIEARPIAEITLLPEPELLPIPVKAEPSKPKASPCSGGSCTCRPRRR